MGCFFKLKTAGLIANHYFYYSDYCHLFGLLFQSKTDIPTLDCLDDIVHYAVMSLCSKH